MSKVFKPYETMSRENLPALIQYQAERIALLERQNAELGARVAELEAQLGQLISSGRKPTLRNHRR